MLRIGILIAILLAAFAHSSLQNYCNGEYQTLTIQWDDMQDDCFQSIQKQVQSELKASLTYFAMTSHFLHYENFRPGLANFFWKSAVEERSHAKKLLHYLHMRGREVGSDTIKTIEPKAISWSSVKAALEEAIELEKSVTTEIKKIIKTCGDEENSRHTNNDYHAVDYLTSEFLTEQYEGTRQIVEYLSTLNRMTLNYGKFAEVLFDKSLEQSE